MTEASRSSFGSATSAALAELERRGLPLRRDVPLAPFTTYRVGGPAAGMLDVSSVDQLQVVHEVMASYRLALLVVGRGSNLLVADAGFDGLALQLTEVFDRIEIGSDGAAAGATVGVLLGAATLLPVAARATVRAGLEGFEWAVGVPGSVGGAVRMNAGGHGSDMAASLRRATVFDLGTGACTDRDVSRLALGYRSSNLADDELVLSVELGLERGDRARSEALLVEIARWRRAHQPGGSNAGSVFANPDGASAGALIEAAGLKGCRIGTAVVSTKHANFIQADAGGSADDVFHLMVHVRDEVRRASGVSLVTENRLVGFPSKGQGPSKQQGAS